MSEMKGQTAHEARLEIIRLLGLGPSSISSPEWIAFKVKQKLDEMQKAIDGIAPFCKAKYGMDDDAVDAIHRLANRSGFQVPEPPKMEEAPKRCTCSEHLGEGCRTCGTPCPLHPNY